MSAVHSQSSSDALIVIYANIEGLTDNKASILSELCKDTHCHCLCLQETHRVKDQARPSIPGMALVAERPHNKHGSSVFVRDCLKFNSISVCEEDTENTLTDKTKDEKKKSWEEVITSTDLTHNSRRAWQTIRSYPTTLPLPIPHV